MGLYDEMVEIPRRTMILFFVVDTSGSMSGSKIGAVNTAIEEVIPELKNISSTNADAQIKIATLQFSTGAEWIDKEPIEADKYRWTYLNSGGGTDFSGACEKLEEKLSKDQFMNEITGSYAPAIFLMSDGRPDQGYKRKLTKLQENNWFKKAIKVAVAIGEDADEDMLAEFTGSREAVISVHTPEALKKWIKFVSIRSSQIGSKSVNVSVDTTSVTSKQKEVIKEIKAEEAVDIKSSLNEYPEW